MPPPIFPSHFQFRNTFYALCPPWLQTDYAERYEYTMQLCSDLLMEKMNQAIRFRLPGLGDPSQLPYLAHDRVLVQGPAESDANFVIRLQEAFDAWGIAGSARAVLMQLQAYLQNLQPGVPATYPLLTIVGGPVVNEATTYATWNQLYQGDALGAPPTLTRVSPSNFDWDGEVKPWRSWLILPMARVATGQSGTAGQVSTAGGGSYEDPGQNVNGVWVPATSGTPINTPFLTLVDLSGMEESNVGDWMTISGSSTSANNGTFPIVGYISSSSVIIANPNGIGPDAGPLTWSVSAYPYIAPGPVWGSPQVYVNGVLSPAVFGVGELTTPATDTGSNVGGVWQPTTQVTSGSSPSLSWGLYTTSTVIQTIRGLVKTWKSAGTYYPNIVIAFDGGDGTAGSAYSPNSSEGSGNPDGSFGSVGKLSAGVWVPTREISSDFDAYCQGTGLANNCTQENFT
jgi:hypothetical protein